MVDVKDLRIGNFKSNKHSRVVTVEYVVQDCPICGKVIVKHYFEKGNAKAGNTKQKVKAQ